MSTAYGGGRDSFFGEVGPDLYRENAFRITGLPVGATARDIRRRTEELRVKARLGVGPAGDGSILPLPRPPDATATHQAMQRLRDPEQRLKDEFFWFWPLPTDPTDGARPTGPAGATGTDSTTGPAGATGTAGPTGSVEATGGAPAAGVGRGAIGSASLRTGAGGERRAAGAGSRRGGPGADRRDAALEALRRGDVDQAVRLWERPAPPEVAAVAAHNLAVLAHVRALDLDGLGGDGRELWDRAFAHWRKVIADDALWDLLDARVREFDDPRLTPSTARRMRGELPSALLSINARLAVLTVRDDRRDEAAGHVSLMRGSGLDGATVDETLRRAMAPDLARIRSLGENAERSADADPGRGEEVTRGFLDRAEPVLDVLGAVLPQDSSALLGARDEVASRVLACMVPYVKRTDDWKAARRHLKRALAIAATESTRGQIEESLEAVRNNLLFSTCWFCKERPAHDDAAFEQKMYGDVNRTYTYGQIRTTWRHGSIKVPRCPACATEHRARRHRMWGFGCLTNILLLGVAIGLFAAGMVLFGVILLVADVIALFVVGAKVGPGVPPAQHKTIGDFEPIKKQLAEGWSYGAKPPNTG